MQKIKYMDENTTIKQIRHYLIRAKTIIKSSNVNSKQLNGYKMSSQGLNLDQAAQQDKSGQENDSERTDRSQKGGEQVQEL